MGTIFRLACLLGFFDFLQIYLFIILKIKSKIEVVSRLVLKENDYCFKVYYSLAQSNLNIHARAQSELTAK